MQLSDEEGFDRLPKLTLSAFIAIVLALVALHLLIQYILSRQFLITAARPLAQKLDSLEYNYVYHLSLVILLLSDVNWNLFDLAIWIGSYVGVGFIRISVQTIKNEQEMLLNDYAYNRNLVKLLCSSQIYGIILFFISITYFFIAFFAFVEAP